MDVPAASPPPAAGVTAVFTVAAIARSGVVRAFGSRGARVGVSTSSGSFVVFLRASAEPCECSAFPRSLSADDPKGIPVTTGSLADFESAAIATEAVAFSAVEGLRFDHEGTE